MFLQEHGAVGGQSRFRFLQPGRLFMMLNFFKAG